MSAQAVAQGTAEPVTCAPARPCSPSSAAPARLLDSASFALVSADLRRLRRLDFLLRRGGGGVARPFGSGERSGTTTSGGERRAESGLGGVGSGRTSSPVLVKTAAGEVSTEAARMRGETREEEQGFEAKLGSAGAADRRRVLSCRHQGSRGGQESPPCVGGRAMRIGTQQGEADRSAARDQLGKEQQCMQKRARFDSGASVELPPEQEQG